MNKPQGYPRMGVTIDTPETMQEAADFAFDNILKCDDESKRGIYTHGYGDGYRKGSALRNPSWTISSAINFLSFWIHKDTKAWWRDLDTGESVLKYPKKHLNTWIGTKLMLVCSEISEAMEGLRKDQMDDKLPHRKMIEVELADAVIRILDLAEGLELNIGGAMAEKLEYNRNREDFKVENRKKEGGKTI